MTSPLVISAKDLGEFAYRDPCLRCLWIKLHVKRLPFQAFPGIFSSLDRYTKAVVGSFFQREGRPPDWLAQIGDVVEHVPPPHYSKFSVEHLETGATLRGEADGIFRLRDGSFVIVDYKTARYTHNQEKLLPQYRAQLNGYAYIANRLEFSPVTRLALVYMEPVTHSEAAAHPAVVDATGLTLGLSVKLVPVPLEPDRLIPPLLERARSLYDTPSCPSGKDGCEDCSAMDSLAAALER